MTFKPKKVLVTGGAGCIGLPVCNYLLEKGIDVVLFDLYEQIDVVKNQINSEIEVFYGSILDDSSLREAINGCDSVIHLAAYLGVRRTEVNKLRCLEINVEGTKKVLEASILANVKKIIFASSSEVYGEPLKNPISESSITQGKTVYAISKLMGEELVKAYCSEYKDINYTILRYFNTYGPNQVAQFVIPKFIRNVMSDISPVIYGDGNQKRSYCFSKDTARGTVDSLLSQDSNNMVLNIGNNQSAISLIDLASLIIKMCGKENINPRIEANYELTDRSSDREIRDRYCDLTLAKQVINYTPKFTLEEGIKEVIDAGVLNPKWATSERDYTIDDSM